MVNERLVWYLEKNGLLTKQQFGYRANRFIVDHLIRLKILSVMHLFKISIELLFSLIYKRLMILHGNMVSNKTYMTWAYEGICPFYWYFFN